MCTLARRAARHEKAAILAALIALEGCGSGTDNPAAENPGPGQSSTEAAQTGDFDAGNSTIAPTGLDAAGAELEPDAVGRLGQRGPGRRLGPGREPSAPTRPTPQKGEP